MADKNLYDAGRDQTDKTVRFRVLGDDGSFKRALTIRDSFGTIDCRTALSNRLIKGQSSKAQ